MARISPGTHTELRNQTTDLSERAQNILLYKERDSVLTQNDTASFRLDAALKKLLLVYHASFSSARKKSPARVSSWKRDISSGGATSPGGSAVGTPVRIVRVRAGGSDRGTVLERTDDGQRDLRGGDRLTRACLRGGAFVGHDDLLCVHKGRARFRPKTRYSKKPYSWPL